MLKLLRKYTPWLLAVFGSLLMVVFLVPEAIQNFAQTAGQNSGTWATIGPDDESLGFDKLTEAQNDLNFLFQTVGLTTGAALRDAEDNPAYWYLLSHEADGAGLVGGNGVDGLAPMYQQFVLARTGGRIDRSRAEALARFNGILHMIGMYVGSCELSDAHLQSIAQRLFHGVSARLVVLTAEVRDDAPLPSPSEIAAHFEAYKDLEPGAGDHGFGYRLPDRFRAEVLSVPTTTIRAMVEASDEIDLVRLYEHWDEYADSAEKNFPPVMEGQLVPAVVREDLTSTVVEEKRLEIERFIGRRLLESKASLEQGADGYFDLPDDWASRRLDLPALAAEIEAEFGLALPTYHNSGDDWYSLNDDAYRQSGGLEPLRSASLPMTGRAQQVPSSQLIAGLRELGKDPLHSTQAGLVMPILRTWTGDIVVARVLDVDPARAPTTVDEVRDAVVRDLQRLADYRDLAAQQDAIAEQARRDGPLAVALAHDAEIQAASPGQPIAIRQISTIPTTPPQRTVNPRSSIIYALGSTADTEAICAAIVDHALALPTDVPVDSLSLAERTVVVASEENLALVVAVIEKQLPLTQADYRWAVTSPQGFAELLRTALPQFEEGMGPNGAFAYETLVTRHNFDLKQRSDDDANADGTPAADAESTDAG